MFGYKKNYDLELYNSIAYFDSDGIDNLECYRKQIECGNYYKGYEYLMNHIIHSFNLKIQDLTENKNSYDTQATETKIKSWLDELKLFITAHNEFSTLNNRFYIKYGEKNVPPLKPYFQIIHDELHKKLNKLESTISYL